MGYFADCITIKDSKPETSLDWQLQGDVRWFSPDLFLGIDAVVHLAAVSNDPMGAKFSQATEDINEKGTALLAKMAKAAGVKKFVFASSCSVYGGGGGDARREQDQIDPLTVYAKSKVNAEKELYELADAKFSVYPLRFATACGGSPRLRLDLVLNDFVASALSSGVIEVLSDGTPWRPLIHLHDMCRAIIWALQDTRHWHGTPINVGSEAFTYQVKDIAAEVAKQTGAEVKINQDAQPDKRSYKVDFNLFQKLAPDYQPIVTLPLAVQDLVTYFTAVGKPVASFREDPLFMRILHLEQLVKFGAIDDQLHALGKPAQS